jgi:GT2 family glycosyltransferase
MKNPLVTLLVLNWNGVSLIKECLDSLKNTDYDNFEILVIDNASTDQSLEILAKIDGIQVVKNSRNIGFAAGNNIGFKLARGDYIVTLNNDVVVEPSWLKDPIETLEGDSTVGIISCRQMDFYQRSTIDVLFYVPTHFLLMDRMGRGEKYGAKPLHSRKGLVLGASGAAAIYRKKMIEEIGAFEESFFAYHEESDLYLRAFLAGWKCVYIPTSVVYHKGSSTFKTVKNTFYYYHERNRIWFIYRFFPLDYIMRNILHILYREARTAINLAAQGRSLVYFKARVDGVMGMVQFSDVRAKNIDAFTRKKNEYLRFVREQVFPLR